MDTIQRTLWTALFAVAVSALPARADATDISEITAKEYWAASYFNEALEHPKIQKISSRRSKIRRIARDIRWKPKKLKEAIRKLEELPGDPKTLATKALEKGFEDSRVKGHVLDVLINDQEPKHVVLYVRWQASKNKNVVKEAATIANVVAKKAPFISTLSLSAIHPKAKKTSKSSVWSAKIGRESMERINERRIEDYADRLYKRLFEGVEERPF